MNELRRKCIGNCSLWFLCLALSSAGPVAAADDSQLFAFNFATNQPLTYAITVKIKTMTDTSLGGKSSLISNSSELRYKARLTAYKKKADGTTLVYFRPYEVAQDADAIGPNHIVTQIRGLKIKCVQNGITIIDTDKNVGMGQVIQIKNGIYPTMLSGTMDFDQTGVVRKLEGDLPFVDYWTNILKKTVGFFQIQFPDHQLAVRDTWTKSITLTSNGGVSLTDPLAVTNTFTREPDEMTNGAPVAVFSMSSSDHLQNLSGYFEQMGQRSSLNIPQYEHSGFGNFHFDTSRGVLLDAKATDSGDISIEMLVQGNTGTSHINLRTEMQMELITEPVVK
jgi:hypothetical protein